MCIDPVSLTIAAATFAAANAPVIATALSATASAYQGISQYQQAGYAAKVADQNADIARRNSAVAMEQGEDQQRLQYQRMAALRGEQTAAFAAQGFDVAVGSPADVIVDTSVGGELDAMKMRRSNTAQVNSYLAEAANYRAEAAGQRRAGTTALVTGFMKAGSTALGGAQTIGGGGGGSWSSAGRQFSTAVS